VPTSTRQLRWPRHPRQDPLVQPQGAGRRHPVQDHALDEWRRVWSPVRW
jgi:hypothetical protein